MKEKVIVVIPARAGSKGVPKKNIKSFLGKPLVQHSIDYAKQSHYVKEIIVTTDDKKIKNLSKELNISVIDRPESLSGDKATTESAIEHVIESKNIQDESIIVLLQPTSPIRPKKSLDKILVLMVGKVFLISSSTFSTPIPGNFKKLFLLQFSQ